MRVLSECAWKVNPFLRNCTYVKLFTCMHAAILIQVVGFFCCCCFNSVLHTSHISGILHMNLIDDTFSNGHFVYKSQMNNSNTEEFYLFVFRDASLDSI